MSKSATYRGNAPSVGAECEVNESNDLKAIRRDMEMHRSAQEMWQHLHLDGDVFRREFEQVAHAAQDWGAATYGQRFRALRILVKHFGRKEAYLLTLMAALKSKQSWVLSIRQRKDSEKSDGGKRDRRLNREDLSHRVAEEVYQRMSAGQSKEDAIKAVKEDYRTGAPYPRIGDLPTHHRPRIDLPDVDGVEKLLGIFRRNARKRGYIYPLAPYLGFPAAREPDLKISDVPKRGRPRKK